MTDINRNRGTFAREAWKLIYPYWFSEEKWGARLLLGVIVGLNLGLVFISVLINKWYNLFYNSLEQKNFEDFKSLLMRFCVLALCFIVTAVYRLYLQQMLEIKWRNWLTANYLKKWLANRRYYILQLKDFGTDNPDQRIAEDLRILAGATLSLTLGLLSAVVTLASFFMILWNLSGSLTTTLFGTSITIPGYMVWAAVGYALLGSILTHLIGRALITLNFNQQRFEADFRFSLIRVREHAEAIALYRGEAREEGTLSDKFLQIWSNWWNIMRYQKRLTWFTATYSQLAVIFPLVVAAPRYFSGAIQLGALMQISSAFGKVQDSLSWFIESYRPLTEWKASVDRLLGFQRACKASDSLLSAREVKVNRNSSSIEANLEVSLPNGTLLSKGVPLNVGSAQRVLVSGNSGTGKSSLFRSISGIWPFAKGTVNLPDESEVMFLPQKPYLPIATLYEAITYPDAQAIFDRNLIVDLMNKIGLEKFVQELSVHDDWSKRLSIGEQQRIAILRALLIKPKWIFFDEATSGLDSETELKVFALFRELLPDASIINIAHKEIQGISYDSTVHVG